MDKDRTERTRSPVRKDDMNSFDGRKTTFIGFNRLERSLCGAGFLQIKKGVFQCHRCAVIIYQHDIDRENRDSWELHARRQPSCRFVKEMQGQEFIEEVLSKEETDDPMINNLVDATLLEELRAEFTRLSERVERDESAIANLSRASEVNHDEMTRRTDHLHREISHSSQMLGSLQGSISSLQSLVDTSVEDMRESLSSTNNRVDEGLTHVFEEVQRLDEAQDAMAIDINQLTEDSRPNNVSDTIPVPEESLSSTDNEVDEGLTQVFEEVLWLDEARDGTGTDTNQLIEDRQPNNVSATIAVPQGRRVPTPPPMSSSASLSFTDNGVDEVQTQVFEEVQRLDETREVVSPCDEEQLK